MKAPLSEAQRQAIYEGGGTPLEIIDDSTHRVFYLISAEQYQKAKQVMEGVEEIDPSFYEFEEIHLIRPQ